MRSDVVVGLLDELQKIAFDTATAMEAIGVPAAMYMGYRQHGLKGALTTGAGAGAGLGAGMLGGHYLKKLTDASPWMQKHRMVKAVVDTLPVGLGGVIGGGVGEQLLEHPHPALSAKTAGILSRYFAKKVSPVILFDTVNDVGKMPGRIKRYEEGLEHDPYDQPGARHAD